MKLILKFWQFVKKEIVFFIALLAAIISSFFVKPSINYVNYIDFPVLGILLSLMLVTGSLQKRGIFQKFAVLLSKKINSLPGICGTLVFLCFFSSMFITNDVALITFVPFAILLLKGLKKEKYILITIILQTIAANCGSMLTPIGNPQNLFLFSKMTNESILDFIFIVLPYTLLSAVLLLLSLLFFPKEKINTDSILSAEENKNKKNKTWICWFYAGCFIITLLSVLHLISATTSLIITLIVCFIFDREQILKADYMLLLTFIAFFIFTGNIGQIESIKNYLTNIVGGKEIICSILSSQVISNVPATLLLYPFSLDYQKLLIGVNIGGLGTVVASLASLISFKFYANAEFAEKKSSSYYLGIFTFLNLIFLTLEILLCIILN